MVLPYPFPPAYLQQGFNIHNTPGCVYQNLQGLGLQFEKENVSLPPAPTHTGDSDISYIFYSAIKTIMNIY